MAQEQNKKFQLPSGATVMITVAPFQDAWGLTKATLKALKGMSFSQEELQRDFASFGEAASAIPAILDRIISFATSEEVEAAMFKCAVRALYIPANSPFEFPGMKVNPGLFDDTDHGAAAREDYAQIVARVLEVNCKPFLAKALSGLSGPRKETVSNAQP